jgi:hypothetical protein
MNRLKRVSKIILFDTLAIICFIGVLLFALVPGPGGLPLFIAGLALLAANHKWAERWLETAKVKGKSFKKILFPNKVWVRNLYDFIFSLTFIGATYLYLATVNRLVRGLAIALACFALFFFLVNRERFDRISSFLLRRKA